MRFLFSALICLVGINGFGSVGIEEMSLEEKVGQTLMVHFYGEQINDDAKDLVQDVKVGGVIYYNWSNGLTFPQQVQELSRGLQNLAGNNLTKIPLLIAVDQEGGIVTRLQEGFTCFPGNRALGATNNPELAKRAAVATGLELRAVGVNMNFAPVVDVNSNPRNPVIGVRSFSNHPEIVTAFGEKSLDGFSQAPVIATLKHFPGHGDVEVDSHEGLPVVHKTLEELEKVELYPFRKLAPFADAVMTAHILVTALDSKNCATLSEKALRYLREDIGFRGVIISDSLVMDGVLEKCHSVDEAAIMALNAGCDLLILGGKLLVGENKGFELTTKDIKRIHGSIVTAVKEGKISEKKLNASVQRILKLKERYAISGEFNCETAAFERAVNKMEHYHLAKQIASSSITTSECPTGDIKSLKDKKVFIVGSKILQPLLSQTSIFTLGKVVSAYFFEGLNPSDAEIEEANKQASTADVVIICSYNAWKNPSAIDLTKDILATGKSVIFLSLRDPLDAHLFPNADLAFTSYSPTVVSIETICDQLKARME